MRTLMPIALAAAVSACASARADMAEFAQDARALPGQAFEAAHRAASSPQLSGVETPAHLAGPDVQTMPAMAPASYSPTAPNSLWRPGARSFFNDQRAQRIGDILTVEIEIADKAELSNSSARQRSGSTSVGVPNFFGLQDIPGAVLPGGYDPSNLISADAQSAQSGNGTINREEKIELTVAAVVVDVLPNGNLVIAGRQEVRINSELRELTVSGVIRPQDIGAHNTIRHNQIAEARISYGGRGQLSTVQRPNWGQRIADAVTPW